MTPPPRPRAKNVLMRKQKQQTASTEDELARRCQNNCLPLIDRGLELHDRERFADALSCFRLALRASPRCPFAIYDLANSLHSMGRDHEAEKLLRDLIRTTRQQLSQHCAATSFRSMQVDAYFLLFRVLLYGRGFSNEAFTFAQKHLSLRRRGVRSVWTIQEIRANIAAMRRAWKAGIKLIGPAPPVSDLRQFTN